MERMATASFSKDEPRVIVIARNNNGLLHTIIADKDHVLRIAAIPQVAVVSRPKIGYYRPQIEWFRQVKTSESIDDASHQQSDRKTKSF